MISEIKLHWPFSEASWIDDKEPDVETRFDPHSDFSRLMTEIKYNAQLVLAELGS